jgi:transposase
LSDLTREGTLFFSARHSTPAARHPITATRRLTPVEKSSVPNSSAGALGHLKIWNEQPLPVQLKAEIGREYQRLELVESQIADTKKRQRESVKKPTTVKVEKVEKLQTLRGIGLDSAWLLVMELLGWREFSNRREVGGSVGLGGTPYDSGQMDREQGISKSGNARVRQRLIELAWLWLRYQPKSSITIWFQERFGAGGKRSKRIGIVAVARKLLIQLWHFVEHDIEPPGAIVVRS